MSKKTIIRFADSSKEIVDEIERLTKEALVETATIPIDLAKRRVNRYTGQLADGLVVDEPHTNMQYGINGITFGYLTRKSFQKNVRTGTFYPNPHWIEFGVHYTKGSPIIQTKQKRYGNENTPLTYQLTGLDGQQYGYEVEHPPMPAKNYLRDACKDTTREMVSTLTDNIKKIEKYEIKHKKELVYEVKR